MQVFLQCEAVVAVGSALVGDVGSHLYMTSHALWIGVADDIGHQFLQGEVQGLEGFIVDALLPTNGKEEGSAALPCYFFLMNNTQFRCKYSNNSANISHFLDKKCKEMIRKG